MAVWRKNIVENFSQDEKSLSDFSRRWVALLLKHQRMLEIYTILYTLLEKNATLEALVDFKKSIFTEMNTGIEILKKVLPFPSSEAAMEFLYASISLTIGIYPLMNFSTKQKEAMEVVGTEMPLEKAMAMLENSTLSLLKGILN